MRNINDSCVVELVFGLQHGYKYSVFTIFFDTFPLQPKINNNQ